MARTALETMLTKNSGPFVGVILALHGVVVGAEHALSDVLSHPRKWAKDQDSVRLGGLVVVVLAVVALLSWIRRRRRQRQMRAQVQGVLASYMMLANESSNEHDWMHDEYESGYELGSFADR